MVAKKGTGEACELAQLYFLAGGAYYMGVHLLYLLSRDRSRVLFSGTVIYRGQTHSALSIPANRGKQFRRERNPELGTEAEGAPTLGICLPSKRQTQAARLGA